MVETAETPTEKKLRGGRPAEAPNPEAPTFAERLVALMSHRDFSQQALADQLGLTRASVSDWCRGKSTPAPITVFAIEDALGVEKGTLAQTLGYLPVGVIEVKSKVPTVLEAIDIDPRLDDYARRLLKMIYAELAGAAPKRRRQRRP